MTGKHRFIADYLNDEVLAPLPEQVQQFMLQTSILDRLCGDLCDTVTGREDGQAMLQAIERANLFLIPLDSNREWFRFHHLFRDFLLEQLKRHHTDELADLHCRAARWYLAQDLPEQAFQHAVAGADVALVGEILERYLFARLLSGEITVVQHWLDSLPAGWHFNTPMIGIAQAGILLATGQFDACARCLDEIEQHILTSQIDAERHRARVVAMRCNIACFQNDLPQAEQLATQALRDLPEDDLDFRSGIHGALGDTYRRNGFWQKAQASYRTLLNYTHAPAFSVQAVHVFGALADLSLQQGHLRDAAAYWQQALAAIETRENWGHYPLPLTGWVYIRVSELLYEWNKLPAAWEHLSRGLERAELGGDVRAMIAGYVIAGRVKLAQGDSEAARYLAQARPHVDNAQFPHWNSRFERLQIELWLARGQFGEAFDWLDSRQEAHLSGERAEQEVAQLARVRVLVVKGDRAATERALAVLDGLLRLAENEGRMGIAIEALALQALAHKQRGEQTGALTALERALRLAEPQGYVRLFSDLGLPMARLLQEAHTRGVMPHYVQQLLPTFTVGTTAPDSDRASLPEPLTDREHEVLELIAAGLTNREIAEALVISPETVKKHASNVYGKLGVSNRTEATIQARKLNLLQ